MPKHPNPPPAPDYWNELLFPKEFPLAFFEMSFLLPHFLKEGRGKLDVYFTRVYNPLWTNPDGFSWMEVLQDKDKIGLHVALTPTWSETAWFADYILPMGLGTERHDTMSQETHAGQWLGFRQPVLRVAREKRGETVTATHEANPGEVWEEAEFWIALSWKIDPDGSLGIRKFFESPVPPRRADHDGRVLRLDVRELGARPARGRGEGEPDAARSTCGKYGVFKVVGQGLQPKAARASRSTRDRPSVVRSTACRCAGFNTPSRKLEFYSPTLAEWGWPEHAIPRYVPGHVHWRDLEARRGRVRSAAELPAADADSHALAGEVAVRDLAQQPAVDLDRGRDAARHRDRRSREGAHRASATSSRARGSPKASGPACSACRTTSAAGG